MSEPKTVNRPQRPSGPAEENDFARQAEQASPGIVAEFAAFLKENKKWWLLPIVLVLLVFGVMLVLTSTAAAPFIYTLF